MKTLRKLSVYIKGYWKDLLLTWLFVLVESICEVLTAYFMQYLIDAVDELSE
jgi:ABC-type multidrug transport system fused ATPase/permease subunit